MDDEKLVARFLRTGDRAMFTALVERYQDRVFRLVVSVLGPGSAADAEEVCQEVFLRVYGKISQFTGEAAFGTWLYRIAYNLAVDWRRRARFRLPHVSLDSVPGLADKADPLGEVLTHEKKAQVARALEGLPDLYRSVLHMHYWLDRPVGEIAELLNVPEGTVKSYLFRARNALKAVLGRSLGKATEEEATS